MVKVIKVYKHCLICSHDAENIKDEIDAHIGSSVLMFNDCEELLRFRSSANINYLPEYHRMCRTPATITVTIETREEP